MWRWHTCLTLELICPTSVRKSRAFIHSFVLRRVSLARSCRCTTTRSRMNFNRGSGHIELIACTLLVMFSIVRSFRLTGGGPGLGVFGDIAEFGLKNRAREMLMHKRWKSIRMHCCRRRLCMAQSIHRPDLIGCCPHSVIRRYSSFLPATEAGSADERETDSRL